MIQWLSTDYRWNPKLECWEFLLDEDALTDEDKWMSSIVLEEYGYEEGAKKLGEAGHTKIHEYTAVPTGTSTGE